MEEKAINGLSDRDLEILDILGVKLETSFLSKFLEKFLEMPDNSKLQKNELIFKLHQQGIALRSIKKIFKKINPNHIIFQKKEENLYNEDTLELLLMAGGF